MTITAFPAHRIVRYYPAQQQQPASLMALLLTPAAMWVGCVQWWIDRILDAEEAAAAAVVKTEVRR